MMKRILLRAAGLKVTGLLLFLFSTITVHAGIKTVTNTDGGESVAGSFGYELMNFEDGDTITFANDLKEETITIATTTSTVFPIGEKELTIIGNGVTITSKDYQTLYLGGDGSTPEGIFKSLRLENLIFKDFATLGFYSFTSSSVISNCKFISTDAAVRDFVIYVEHGHTIFEGCAFIAGNSTSKSLHVKYNNGNSIQRQVDFISCTFVRGNVKSNSASNSLIYFSESTPNTPKTFTNCVFVDPNATTRATNTININAANLVFKGYNVIQGTINGSWARVASSHPTDTIVPKTDPSPLFFEDGIYKVVGADNANGKGPGPAYKRLPANHGTRPELDGISFPLRDLAGTEIDYTVKTHSGAWQAVYGDEYEEPVTTIYPTEVTIGGAPESGEILCNVIGENKTFKLTAAVLPFDGCDQTVSWASSNPDVATIDAEGNVTIPYTEAEGDKTVTFTATSTALKENSEPVTAFITVTVKPYVRVTSFSVGSTGTDTIRLLKGVDYRLGNLGPTIVPEDAVNKDYIWSIKDEDREIADVGYNTVQRRWLIKGKRGGTVTVTAVADENPELTDSCVFIFREPYYSDVNGVFFLTEGTYPGQGEIHFLNEETGAWDTRLYSTLNDGKVTGVTTQFATIYGDKFFFVSKQENRLVIADKTTLAHHKSFKHIYTKDGQNNLMDGRAFLGVDENTGYVSTASGICVVKFDELAEAEEEAGGYAVTELPYTPILGTESEGGDSNPLDPNFYLGQVGTMIRVGDRVFAVQQNSGIRVINALTHRLETTLAGNYAVLTQSKDGHLWAGSTASASGGGLDEPSSNVLIHIDPWTLEIEEIPVPEEYEAPPTSWGAWHADLLCGSATENKIYWSGGGMWLSRYIYEYDIDNKTFDLIFDSWEHPTGIEEHPNEYYNMYNGCAFRVHPATGELYVALTTWHINPVVSKIEYLKINPATKEKTILPGGQSETWHALWIFPDNHAPVISDALDEAITVSGKTGIYLGNKVTDADNMDAAIVKTPVLKDGEDLITARVWRDSLIITPVKQVEEDTQTTFTLKVNSNGKVVTKDLTVTVEPGAIAHPVTGVTINNPATAKVAVGQTLQLAATVAPPEAENRTLTWSSSQPLVASVDQTGLVTVHLAPGTAYIIATTVEGGFRDTCTVTTTATAPPPPLPAHLLILNLHTATLDIGKMEQLNLVYPDEYTAVTWRSNNEDIAIASSTGKVIAMAAGTAWITAKDLITGRSDSCKITVRAKPVEYTVRLNHTALMMNAGDRTAIAAAVSPSTGAAIAWSSNNTKVAEVTASGTVIAVAGGSAVITALAGGTSATCNVTVRDISVYADVSNIGTGRATLSFPLFPGAAYYLVHLFEISGSQRMPAISYKINPDGTVGDIVHLRASQANISLIFTELKPATAYEADVDVMREINGTTEAVSKLNVSFTTAQATGIERIEAINAAVWYSDGTLRLHNLEGYHCRITSVSGQVLINCQAASGEESRSVSLSPGVYILTAQKEGERLIFKFAVF